MNIDEKIKILNSMFDDLELLDEKDKSAVVAYISATRDTRERVNMEHKMNLNMKAQQVISNI